ncbi:MAG: DUF3575 domain-containing protein [Phocaeicola sp.]
MTDFLLMYYKLNYSDAILNLFRRCTLLIIFFSLSEMSSAQLSSLQTNILGWGSTNMNLEYSLKWNNNLTFHIPLQYNPFSFGDARLRNLTFTPGIRYWFRESYAHSLFVGVHGISTIYNIGGLLGNKYRYEGIAFGGGVSLGYSKPLSKRWNLEFELGAGLIWTKYDKFMCGTCGKKISVDNKKLFLVPSKLAINLVHLF